MYEKTMPNPNPSYEMESLLGSGDITALAFSADGKFLAAGTSGSTDERKDHLGSDVLLWNVNERQIVKKVALDQQVTSLVFVGEKLLVGTSSVNPYRTAMSRATEADFGRLRVFDVPGLHELHGRQFEVPVGNVRASPNGRWIAVNQVWPPSRSPGTKYTYGRGEIVILDSESLVSLRVIGIPHNLHGLIFTPGSDSVLAWDVESPKAAIPGSETALRVFDTATGVLQSSPPKAVWGGVLISVDEGRLVTLWADGVFEYDLATGKSDYEPLIHAGEDRGRGMRCMSLSPDANSLLFAAGPTGDDKRRFTPKVAIQDRNTKRVDRVYEGPLRMTFKSCAYSPDNIHFAVGTDAYREEATDPFQSRVLLFKKK
jgi:WD40 repeat protein